MSLTIYVLNGPNLNLLGEREPAIYGTATLADLEKLSQAAAAPFGATVVFRQSNHEGELVDWVQEARRQAAAVVINAGGYTHSSVALHDALKVLTIPVVEVHLSNPGNREDFRHKSLVSPAASGVIAGFGPLGYRLAIEAAVALAAKKKD
ncbi:MAG: type II 3-dehydroquinate dehydratase [Rhodobacterales bacterium 12-64-8]|nr:MAG: type II 3-dehydroquinate dehydratase [Rhodobacterales bacterium 12-64-8]OYX49192.1 MAG: type II 3-dehydroquinate dehydratase [Alphaproteobacteria bacterium 32-64-14]